MLSGDRAIGSFFLFFCLFVFFLAPTEKIKPQSLATDNLRFNLQSTTTGAQERENEGRKMTSGIDLVWVEVRAKTARKEAPVRLFVDLQICSCLKKN